MPGQAEQLDFVARPLVYVAGPYTHPDPAANVNIAIRIAGALADSGLVTPFVPHLTMLWHVVEPRPIEFWYAYDLAFLARCDAVLRLPGASTGADAEVDFGVSHGLSVHESVEDVLRWAEAR